MIQVLFIIIHFTIDHKVNPSLAKGVDYFEKYSKHRMILPVYDLEPIVTGVWVAPNATIGKNISFNRHSC